LEENGDFHVKEEAEFGVDLTGRINGGKCRVREERTRLE
jgi:hypothetical protein